jgi:hypothetical protein
MEPAKAQRSVQVLPSTRPVSRGCGRYWRPPSKKHEAIKYNHAHGTMLILTVYNSSVRDGNDDGHDLKASNAR